jgi:lysophospholipase L1-like esterase
MSGRDLTALGVALAVALLIGVACTVSVEPTPSPMGLRYVAMGDSYTIGTSVSSADSWPSQLVARLDGRLELVANLGVNGYSTDDLIAAELPALDDLHPEFVTVQIGVNDVVRGVPQATYAANIELILDALLERLAPTRIVAVATPDYTLTPAGSSFGNPAQQSAEIARFNDVLRVAAEARGIAFVPDIYEISRQVVSDPSLVASDGLHPSGAQYALWVDAILPVAESLLSG